MKRDADDFIINIAAYLFFGVPVAACAVFSLALMFESGDFFIPGLFFIFSSLICLLIVNALSPVLAVITVIICSLCRLVKAAWLAARKSAKTAKVTVLKSAK